MDQAFLPVARFVDKREEILRRAAGMLAGGDRPVYASGECEIDLARRELRVLGAAVPVGGRAFEVIKVLAQSAGELVTREELMNRVWPGVVVLDNRLRVHTAAVRKALGPYRGLLKTESGRGYRLLGSWIQRHHGPPTPSDALQQLRGSGQSPPTNFPAIATGLIGRSAAVQRLRDLDSAYRVVTLTGPGGIGKTTLALEVAQGLLAEFDSGGWLVELASLSDPDLVPSAVAGVLGLKLDGEELSAEAVARAAIDRNLLLVLDNCEHVVDSAADLAETFVRVCRRATILATSREVLRISGEYVHRVPPLEVPAPGQREPDDILGRSAVELFIARRKALNSDFSPRDEHVGSIAGTTGIGLPIAFIQRGADAPCSRDRQRSRGARLVLLLRWGHGLGRRSHLRLCAGLVAPFADGRVPRALRACVAQL